MITLDVQDNYIRLLVARRGQVETAASLPLEPGLVSDGVIIDKVTVGRRIVELMAANGLAEKKVAIGLSGIHAIYRTVPVPQLPKNMMAEAARREMERVMPVSLNELYTSWQTISTSNLESIICLVGLPRSTVDAMLETLRQAGLQPEAMEIRPLALARVTDERTAIVINAEMQSFDIVVMIGGIPEILRSLSFTAEATSPDEKIAEVKEELDRTITYYNSGHRGTELTPNTAAFVSGQLGDMLAQSLEYKVRPLPQLLSYVVGLNTGEYAANIGLALREAKPDVYGSTQVNLNVTPEAYLPKAFPTVQLVSWAFVLLAIAVLVLFGAFTFQSYRTTVDLQLQVSSAERQVRARQGTEATIGKLQTQIDDAQASGATFTKPLDTAKAQREKVNGDLGTITSLMPGIIDPVSITYSNGYAVAGTAPDDTTVVNYVRDLISSGRFQQVLISSMNELKFNNWSFILTLK